MKLTCEKNELKNAVVLSEKITTKHSPLPILSAVLLEAKEKTLIIKSTNLDVGVEFEISADVKKGGTIAVPGGVLSVFLSNLTNSEGEIKIEQINQIASFVTTQNNTSIKTLPHSDFPRIPRLEQSNKGVRSFDLSAQKLIEGVKDVWYAASVSDIKPELASIYIYQEEGDLFFVATDSFRLAEKKITLGEKADKKITNPILIPTKNAIEIVRIFEKENSNLKVSYTENQISIFSPGVYVTSRVVDGVFPDYKQIVPKGHQTEVHLQKQEMINALKITNVFSNKFNQVETKVIPDEKLFEITSSNQDTGETVTKLEATTSGQDFDGKFNSRYILDCFQSIPGDNISFYFNGDNKPLVIKPGNKGNFVYLVMPLHK